MSNARHAKGKEISEIFKNVNNVEEQEDKRKICALCAKEKVSLILPFLN